MYHKDLEAYKLSMEFVTQMYELTSLFPKFELFGLTSQIRRCAVSIPSNIAEGCARFSDKESAKFINVAVGSIAELDTQLQIAYNLGYINSIENLQNELNHINALTLGLNKFFNKT